MLTGQRLRVRKAAAKLSPSVPTIRTETDAEHIERLRTENRKLRERILELEARKLDQPAHPAPSTAVHSIPVERNHPQRNQAKRRGG